MKLVQMREFLIEVWNYIWNNVSEIEAMISIGCILCTFIIWLISKIKNRSVNKYLRRWFSKEAMRSLRYYIATTGQQIDPCENEEIGETNDCKITNQLIPFFINKVFKNKVQNQYFVILGDSGMGKTTFMMQLFKAYRRKHFKKYKMEFIPLSYQICLEEIKGIKNPTNTILLLDGLDENPEALDNYDVFMEELLKVTQGFNKIIITCRTQFFPNKASEPADVGYSQMPFNLSNKKNRFYKIYVSPLEEKDIMIFLRKKYPFFINAQKRKRAWEVISKSPYLMVRPMLLSYIDGLIQEDNEYQYVYQIYEQLTGNWISRENISYQTLYEFSRRTARYMYDHNSNYIGKEEISIICNEYAINIRVIEAKSRSLLNRNGIGDYKFAHKSIYEYFLAKEAMENIEYRKKADFSKLNMAALFFREMCEVYIEERLLHSSIISGDFTNMVIRNIDFSPRRFKNAVFDLAQIYNCDFTNCNLKSADFNGCTFNQCDLSQARINIAEQVGTKFLKCEMARIIFEDATCRTVWFTECSLPEAVFAGSVCEDIFFDKCNMQGVSFENSKIIRGNFQDIDLRRANLKNWLLDQSSFTNSNLAFSNLSGAIISRDCIFNSTTLAPIVYDTIQAGGELLKKIGFTNTIAELLK